MSGEVSEALRHGAERLIASGRVSGLRILQNGAIVTGIVDTHRVYIRAARGECSCQEASPCVHIVAVKLAAATHAALIPTSQARAPRAEFSAQAETAALRLFYLFETPGEPTLSVWVGADAKSAVPFSLRTAGENAFFPRYVDAEDRAVLQMLTGKPLDAPTLKRAVATGRTFWPSLQGEPLTMALETLTPETQSRLRLHPKLHLLASTEPQLIFVYNGREVDASSLRIDAPTVRIPAGDRLLEIARDLALEQRWRERWEALRPASLNERVAWLELMSSGIPALEVEGWHIAVDESFPYRLATLSRWCGDVEPGQRPGWFSLRLTVSVDGQLINLLPTLASFLQTPQGNDSSCRAGNFWFMRLEDGRWLPIPLERVQRIADTLVELVDRDALDEHAALPRLHATRLAQLTDELDDAAFDLPLRELVKELKQFSGIQALRAPPEFHATLRPYQEEGLGWLQFLRRFRLGGILADDMGLGKTIQTLAHLVLEKTAGRLEKPTLIVAPTSVIGNWRREFERFAPDLTVLFLHGSHRRDAFGAITKADVVITSYSLLLIDSEILLSQEFQYLILDEAQTVKNPRAKVSQIARALRAQHRLGLTGTPMENHLGELWSLLDVLMPGLLGSERAFQRHYREPIEKHNDHRRAAALSLRIAPFLLRRTKDTVATDLPMKTQIVAALELDEQQRDFYDSIRLAMHRHIRDIVRAEGLARSQIAILDALLKLRQACCDPRLLGVAGSSIPSVKLEWLTTVLPELTEEGRRILLFSQFTSMLALIEKAVKALDIPYCLLTGDTRQRDAVVARFQNGEAPLFLISLKAGGTGLNLTAADTVIHYDPWWNPAVEAQATDRAHRIGQDKPVFVYKLIAQGTIEEKILELQKRKEALVGRLYTEKSASPSALTAEDLEALFAP